MQESVSVHNEDVEASEWPADRRASEFKHPEELAEERALLGLDGEETEEDDGGEDALTASALVASLLRWVAAVTGGVPLSPVTGGT